jgi:hypothetical protein
VIQECLPHNWKCEDSGLLGGMTVAGALMVALLGGPSVALARVEPYCPSQWASKEAHQVFDMDKLCVLVYEDLAEGRGLEFGKRLADSRRVPAGTAPSPRPRARSTPEGPVSRQKPSTPVPATPAPVASMDRGEAGPRRQREAVSRPDRPSTSVSRRGNNARRIDRRQRQDNGTRSPRRDPRRDPRRSPTTTPSPAPSPPASRPSSSPTTTGGAGDAPGYPSASESMNQSRSETPINRG